jgi:15-cis-phytoene synthase
VTPSADALTEAYAHCEALVRAADKTAWLAALFAPEPARPALHALRAFLIEIDAVRAKVREPLAGELRLQWWVEAIEGEARGDVQGNPVAAALLDTISRFRLSRPAMTDIIEVRRAELYDEVPPDLAQFDLQSDRSEGAALAMMLRTLGAETDASRSAALQAGRVLAVTRSLVALGLPQAGQIAVRLPLSVLAAEGIGLAEVAAGVETDALRRSLEAMQAHAEAAISALRGLRGTVPAEAGPAFLPVNIAAHRLRLLRHRADPFAPPPEIPQWRKQWILWRAAGRNGVL